MKMNEIKGLETKELAEKLETEVANYNQMKLNHTVTPMENPSQIKAARGNKKFKKDKTGCRYQ